MHKVKYNLIKGKSIIIAEATKDGVILTDGIIVDTACTVSIPESDIQVIQNAKIGTTDRIIYITGHTTSGKNKIGGLSVDSIAKYLVNAGYDGSQDIYITSCNAASKHKYKCGEYSIVDLLKNSLYFELNRDKKEESEYFPLNCINVNSDSDGLSVVTEDIESTNTEIWVLKADSIHSRLFTYSRLLKQKNLLHELKADRIRINTVSADRDIKNHHKNIKDTIEHYKRQLVADEIIKQGDHLSLSAMLNISGIILTIVVMMLMYLLTLSKIDIFIGQHIVWCSSAVLGISSAVKAYTIIHNEHYKALLISTIAVYMSIGIIIFNALVSGV